jgi:hypothetical protein
MMRPQQVFEALAKGAAGTAPDAMEQAFPNGVEQGFLRRDPDFELACQGDREALERLVAVWQDLSVLRTVGGTDPKVRFPRAPESEKKANHERREAAKSRRAVALARQVAEFASQPDVHMWCTMGATVKHQWLGAGSDKLGRWRDVMVWEWPRGTPCKLRLRADAMALEVHPEAGSRSQPDRGTSGSMSESLLTAARRLALWVGCSEASAVRFLLEGKVPKPEPLAVRVTQAGDQTTVTLAATADVPVAVVARAFARAAGRPGRPGSPESGRTMAIVALVRRMTAANDGQWPTWPRITARLIAEHPEWKADYRDVRKTFLRFEKRHAAASRRSRRRAAASPRRARARVSPRRRPR